MASIITLTTDFGLKDQYAGAMKGAILSVNPGASLVDISHSIKAGGILEGAFVLAGACGLFPPGTVHLGVVDPGVGGTRRGVIVETERFLFVGPDNGLLSLAAEGDGIKRVIDIKKESFFRDNVSATFHGRDIFGPVAGHLSLGVGLNEFGPEISDLLMVRIPEPILEEGAITGEVLHIDSYGNIITNIFTGLIESHLGGLDVKAVIKGRAVSGLFHSYGSISPRGLGVLTGSSRRLEVAAREGNASDILGAAPGDKVRIVRR